MHKSDENPLGLEELDFSKPLMSSTGLPVFVRPDLFVVEGTTGRHSVVDKYGRTTVNQIRRVFYTTEDAATIRAAAAEKFKGDPEEKEKARQERKKRNAAREKAKAAVEKDRMAALQHVMGRLEKGYQLDTGKAASQIARRTGESRSQVFWWLIRITKSQPEHPARAYMADAGTSYMVLFNPGPKADNAT